MANDQENYVFWPLEELPSTEIELGTWLEGELSRYNRKGVKLVMPVGDGWGDERNVWNDLIAKRLTAFVPMKNVLGHLFDRCGDSGFDDWKKRFSSTIPGEDITSREIIQQVAYKPSAKQQEDMGIRTVPFAMLFYGRIGTPPVQAGFRLEHDGLRVRGIEVLTKYLFDEVVVPALARQQNQTPVVDHSQHAGRAVGARDQSGVEGGGDSGSPRIRRDIGL